MKITSVQISRVPFSKDKIKEHRGQLVGMCSVMFDDVFIVRGIRMIRTLDKQFLIMPYRKVSEIESEGIYGRYNQDWRPKNYRPSDFEKMDGERQSLAFPINKTFTRNMTDIVFGCLKQLEDNEEAVYLGDVMFDASKAGDLDLTGESEGANRDLSQDEDTSNEDTVVRFVLKHGNYVRYNCK